MTNVVAVVVAVPEGDPGGLLRPTVGGYPLPQCKQPWHEDYGSRTGGTWGEAWDLVEYESGWGCSAEDPPHAALILWWDGRLCPEGWDRFQRCMQLDPTDLPPEERPSLDLYQRRWPTLEEVLKLAMSGQRLGLGRVVFLDSEGREVQP